MAEIRLLSTDFDGTLIEPGGTGRCGVRLAQALEEARARGSLWVINTGRSLEHAMEGIASFAGPFAPDFLIVNERHVYERRGQSWQGWSGWNERCDQHHEDLFARSRALFQSLAEWAQTGPGVQLLPTVHAPQGLITHDEETMELTAAWLDARRNEHPEFSYQRNSIYLRFCHHAYHKGSALEHLREDLGLAASHTLAAGDNHNDLGMLDGISAGLVTCPANAVTEVRQAVHQLGGYVSPHPFGEGTADGIFHFLEK
jgi:HAD superfamily hydrolase (TIGR01484 family)